MIIKLFCLKHDIKEDVAIKRDTHPHIKNESIGASRRASPLVTTLLLEVTLIKYL